MTVHVARNDAVAVPQVDTLTPVVSNSSNYQISVNTKKPEAYASDADASAKEIVEGVQTKLAASSIPEVAEITFTEDDTKITATGPSDGTPVTIVDASNGGTAALTVASVTVPKSSNHWIAENFSSGTLPDDGDTVVITQLSQEQGFLYGLNQTGIALAELNIKADSQAPIGLPELTGSPPYYQEGYRETSLTIGSAILKIGEGIGQGAGRIKLILEGACAATVYQTGSPFDTDEAAVHLSGSDAGNSLFMLGGQVDIAMLPGHTAQWPAIIVSGGRLRCGEGVTLGSVQAAGDSTVETRSAVTTLSTRDTGSVTHFAGNIATLDVAGGNVAVQASTALTIAQLNGYSGKTLDLSDSGAAVTITAATIYATPDAPFTINDPNNKLTMSAAASTPNGAQSLVVVTGSGRNVRIT